MSRWLQDIIFEQCRHMDMLKIDATTIGFCLNSFALGKIKIRGEVNQ